MTKATLIPAAAAIALAALLSYLYQTEPQPSPVPDSASDSPPARSYRIIGHEDDALAGPAFTAPIENSSLKPADWLQQPVVHPEDAGEVDLAISLDQQIYDMLLADVQAFAHSRNVKIAVNRGTCGVSATQLGRKQADVAGFCCPPGTEDRLPGLRYHTIGIGAIALLVHPDNPISDISRSQARQIYQWRLQNWSELDGAEGFDKSITPVTRLHCKSRPGHWTLLLGDEARFSPNSQNAGDINHLLNQVARYPDAIGYETLFWAGRHDMPLKPLLIDGIAPSDLNALAFGAYPFYRTFNLTTWHDAAAQTLAADLVKHLTEVVAEKGAQFHIASSARLKQHGWEFAEDELIAPPQPVPAASR